MSMFMFILLFLQKLEERLLQLEICRRKKASLTRRNSKVSARQQLLTLAICRRCSKRYGQQRRK